MTESNSARLRQWLLGTPGFILFALAVTGLYFGPFLNNYFSFDDFSFIEHIHMGPSAVLLGYNNILRLVPNSIWWPMYEFFGLNPLAYNIMGAALYLINAILCYLLLSRLFADRTLAFLGAGIFVTSAVGSDAIFWKAASATPVNLCFYLLTLYLYVIYRQLNQRKILILSLAVFLLATFSKEESASLPFIILLLEILYFDKCRNLMQLGKKVAPFVAVILFYLVVNYIVIYFMVQGKSELVKNSTIKPLYSLLGGFSVFFVSPTGLLDPKQPAVYLTALLILLSLVLLKDRRLLLLGYGWVFFTFLPQSLSTLAQYPPRNIVNSISRYLYLPSIGAALVFTAVLLAVRDRLSPRKFLAVCIIFMTLFTGVQFKRIQERGALDWHAAGARMARYVEVVTSLVPEMRGKTYVFITNPPEGRAFTQQSLRAVYRNPAIFWKNDPEAVIDLKPGEHEYLIDYDWQADWYQGVPGRILYAR